MGAVVVVGSVNVDHVVRAPRLPGAGETVIGGTAERHPGGKGANAAVAAARTGAAVAFVGAVGDDADGALSREALASDGVQLAGLAVADAPTGVALIVVGPDGENLIAVASGANEQVALPGGWRPEAGSDPGVVLTGFEVPDEAVVAALAGAAAAGWIGVLDPAPARPLPDGLPDGVLLCPNAAEAAALSGEKEPERAARALAARTRGPVVVTLGAAGALLLEAAEGAVRHVDPPGGVEAVDATGAGDVLAGVLAAGLAADDELGAALDAAVRAATASTATVGARAYGGA